MAKTGIIRQEHLELDILRCLASHSPRSLGEIRDWIGRHSHLSPEDHVIKRFDSNKELPAYAIAVGNSLTRPTKNNCRGRGLVESLHRDSHGITKSGRSHLANEEKAITEIQALIGDISFADE